MFSNRVCHCSFCHFHKSTSVLCTTALQMEWPYNAMTSKFTCHSWCTVLFRTESCQQAQHRLPQHFGLMSMYFLWASCDFFNAPLTHPGQIITRPDTCRDNVTISCNCEQVSLVILILVLCHQCPA